MEKNNNNKERLIRLDHTDCGICSRKQTNPDWPLLTVIDTSQLIFFLSVILFGKAWDL